jgi:hypothetical protein
MTNKEHLIYNLFPNKSPTRTPCRQSCMLIYGTTTVPWGPRSKLDLEAKASHAGLVLFDHGLALLGRVVGFGEEHAVIAGRLFLLANTAGLQSLVTVYIQWGSESVVPWAFRPERTAREQRRRAFRSRL